MRILIIPEITELILIRKEMFDIEENIAKLRPNLSIANLMAWSIFADFPKITTLEFLVAGYDSLSKTEHFKSFDIYIGYLHKNDFDKVDLIIYSSQAAKEIFEIRFKDDILPAATETVIVTGENTIENEVYKRTIIHNISKREKETN